MDVMSETAAQPQDLMGWMNALGDSTRLRLLRLLERNELSVAELCDILQLPQSTVSKHLKVLNDGSWTRHRKQGTTHLYRTILDELDATARRLWLISREQTEDWPTVKQDELRLSRVLREKSEGAEAFFAGAAGQWDKLRTELYGEGFTHSALLALLPSDYVVADLGCGTGNVAATIAPNVKHVIGVDASAAMLKAARKRCEDSSNVDLRRGDLSAIPIEDGSCDAALLLLVLTYVPEPETVLRELSRILKTNGKAVIVDLLPHDRDDFRRQMDQQHMGFAADRLKSMLQASGCTEVRIAELAPEPEAKGPAMFLATAVKP
jgi:ArsR family transcriptional regulator